MARKLKSYDLLTTSYFPVRPVFPVVFFFLKAIDYDRKLFVSDYNDSVE
jgi:hypothetical protein